MGDQQRRPALALPHAFQPALHTRAGQCIQRAKGLVEQQHVALLHHGAQKGGALAHAAGKLGRPGALETGKAELSEQRRDAFARRLAAKTLHFQPQRHIVDDAPPRHQRVALRHEGEGAALQSRAVEAHVALAFQRAGQQLEQRRLAGAGRAEDGDELAGRDMKRNAGEHLKRAEVLPDVPEFEPRH
ncbi:hypothetical protein X732_19735 [Mesorhizobium sp. L2C066B000]|nr:hypothetical protein X732_19735 [Mesorhizobium sp. L2C066B000]